MAFVSTLTFINTTPIKPAERQENPSESRFGTGW
jgi:hypothetical protein